MRAAAAQHPAVVVLDIGLPDLSGLEVRAAVRRAAAPAEIAEPVVETAAFTVDLWAKKVIKNGSEVRLTPTESEHPRGAGTQPRKASGPRVAAQRGSRPFPRGRPTNYLRVYLAQLRRKLDDDPSHPNHLLTEAGMGYRFQQ